MSKTVHMDIPVYSLPEDTDTDDLTPRVWAAIQTLEEMGVYNQFDPEPLYRSDFERGGNIE